MSSKATETTTRAGYLVEIRPDTSSSGDRQLRWKVTAPDGRVQQGLTWMPAWRWMARWSARRAARWLMKQGDGSLAETYTLRRSGQDADDVVE